MFWPSFAGEGSRRIVPKTSCMNGHLRGRSPLPSRSLLRDNPRPIVRGFARAINESSGEFCMRRAIAVLIFLAFLVAPARSAMPVRTQSQPLMNAIGLIEYSHKPTFKPGDWVRYRVTGANNEGVGTDYTVTVLIAGEERFWGEDCFWVETRTQAATSTAPIALATLMSYSIFEDSLAMSRLKLYMRKSITDIDENGALIQDVLKRPPSTLKNRKPPSEHTEWSVDTVGVDTVQVPTGLYSCVKVILKEGIAATSDRGDSSSRTEVRDIRTLYYSDRIPVTRLAREHIENTVRRKSWTIGHSQEGELLLVGLSEGDARLDAFGTGLESGLVPKRFHTTIRQQPAAAERAPGPKAKSKRPG
jgi:hypothetical protein